MNTPNNAVGQFIDSPKGFYCLTHGVRHSAEDVASFISEDEQRENLNPCQPWNEADGIAPDRREETWANALLAGDVIDMDASYPTVGDGYRVIERISHGAWLDDGHRQVFAYSADTTYPMVLDSHRRVIILARSANFATFPVIDPMAIEHGCEDVDSYARSLAMDVSEYVSVEDCESASFIGELGDVERLTLSFLDTMSDRGRTWTYRQGYTYHDVEWSAEADETYGGWLQPTWAIVNVTSNGVVFLMTYASEKEYEDAMDGWRQWEAEHYASEDDEDASEDASEPVCNGTPYPDSDRIHHETACPVHGAYASLAEEVKDAERWAMGDSE